MTPFRLAYLNLFRRPLSTWIAILGISVAVATSGILLKIYTLSHSRFSTLANEGQSVVGAKAGGIDILLGSLNLEGGYPGFVPYNLFASIHSHQAVQFEDGAVSSPSYIRAVIPFLYFADFEGYRVIGTSADFIHRPLNSDSPQLATGQWLKDGARDDVVVGSEVAKAQRLTVGSEIRVHTAVGSVPEGFSLHVIGLLAPTGRIWDYALFSSIEEAQLRLAKVDLRDKSIWGTKVLNYFLIYHGPEATPGLRSLIDQRTVGQMISVQNEIEHLERLTGTGRNLGLLLTVLILLLSSASVATMMIARFESMAVQLAILRALGFQKVQIAYWLLWEGLILGFIAVVIGASIDFAFFPWIRSVSGLNLPSYVPNPNLQSATVWLAAIAVTVLAVVLPLLRLYRQDVNAALKS